MGTRSNLTEIIVKDIRISPVETRREHIPGIENNGMWQECAPVAEIKTEQNMVRSSVPSDIPCEVYFP